MQARVQTDPGRKERSMFRTGGGRGRIRIGKSDDYFLGAGGLRPGVFGSGSGDVAAPSIASMRIA